MLLFNSVRFWIDSTVFLRAKPKDLDADSSRASQIEILRFAQEDATVVLRAQPEGPRC